MTDIAKVFDKNDERDWIECDKCSAEGFTTKRFKKGEGRQTLFTDFS